MPAEVREGIEAVAIDTWEPYINAVKRWRPQADDTLQRSATGRFRPSKGRAKILFARVPGRKTRWVRSKEDLCVPPPDPRGWLKCYEGVNNKIKVVKRIAYGLHDLEYLAVKVKQALPGRLESNYTAGEPEMFSPGHRMWAGVAGTGPPPVRQHLGVHRRERPPADA